MTIDSIDPGRKPGFGRRVDLDIGGSVTQFSGLPGTVVTQESRLQSR